MPSSSHRLAMAVLFVGVALGVPLAGVAVGGAGGPGDAGSADAGPPAGNVSLAEVTAPETVAPGSDYRIAVALANDGATATEVTLRYAADGRVLANRTVSVPPDGRTVALNRTAPTENGTRVDHRVTAVGETWTGTTVVRGRARFVVVEVRKAGGPPQAAAGERVEVVGRVRNEGNVTDTQVVRVVADGTVVANETLTLGPEQSAEVTARAVATADGRYGSLNVRVVTADDAAETSIPVERTPTPTPTDGPDDGPTPTRTSTSTATPSPTADEGSESGDARTIGDASPGLGVPAALIALLLVALALGRGRFRRR